MKGYYREVEKWARRGHMLPQWLVHARKELADFLQKNPEKIDRFRMRTYHNTSDDPNYNLDKVRTLPNGRFSIETRPPFNGWDSESRTVDYKDGRQFINDPMNEQIARKASALFLGQELKPYTPNEQSGYDAREIAEIILSTAKRGITGFDAEPISGYFSNPARNRLVREIEEKTGFNIKMAIQSKYKFEKAKGTIPKNRSDSQQRISFWQRLFG